MHQEPSQSLDSGMARPTLNKPGLLVMDVDATLINEEVIDELGTAAGIGRDIADITARAMNGELDFEQALRERVSLLKGLPTSVFDEVYRRIHFTEGALDMIREIHAHGWKVGVVSGGFHEIVDRLAEDAAIDHRIANRLGAENGMLTGMVEDPIVTKDVKLAMLHQWAAQDGIPMAQTVAMGDGANDLPMIHEAALGVAFCAKPAVREQAPYEIRERDLRLLLDFLR